MWATWCPPCVRMIPHLSKLSKEYTNVKFIGVSNEPVARITPFLTKMGENMCYNVASGDLSDYNSEYDVSGIPHAFIINGGKVVFSGHPAEPDFEAKLKEVNVPRVAKLDWAGMSREDAMALPVSTIKEQAKLLGVSVAGCLEKSEFVDAIFAATKRA